MLQEKWCTPVEVSSHIPPECARPPGVKAASEKGMAHIVIETDSLLLKLKQALAPWRLVCTLVVPKFVLLREQSYSTQCMHSCNFPKHIIATPIHKSVSINFEQEFKNKIWCPYTTTTGQRLASLLNLSSVYTCSSNSHCLQHLTSNCKQETIDTNTRPNSAPLSR